MRRSQSFMQRFLLAVITMLLLSRPIAAENDQKEVNDLIHTAVNSVLEILRNKELNKETKKDRVMSVIDKVFDIPLMAKLALGRKHWPKLKESEKKEFVDLYIKTLKDSYFDKMDLLTDEYVEFDPPVKNEEKFQMLTYIISKGQRYKMNYKLYRKKDSSPTSRAGGGSAVQAKESWKVYDVEIEGISFVKSYGAQYDQFLQTSSVQKLLEKMREKSLDVPKDLKAKEKRNKTEESGKNNPP